MKKKTKKLVLAKETVRRMGDLTLSIVAGGYDTNTNCNPCTYNNSCRPYCLDEPIGP